MTVVDWIRAEENAVNTIAGVIDTVLLTTENSLRLLFSAAQRRLTRRIELDRIAPRRERKRREEETTESWAETVPLAA